MNIKYIMLLATPLFYVANISNAQLKYPLRYSVQVGHNEQDYTWIEGDDEFRSAGSSITARFVAEKRFKNANMAGWSLGAGYLQSGYQMDLVNGGKSTWKNTYIDIPLELHPFSIAPFIYWSFGIGSRVLLKSELTEDHHVYDSDIGAYKSYRTTAGVTSLWPRVQLNMSINIGLRLNKFAIIYRYTGVFGNRFSKKLEGFLSEEQLLGSTMVSFGNWYSRLVEDNIEVTLAYRIN